MSGVLPADEVARLRHLHEAASTAKEPWQVVDAEQAIQHRLRLTLPHLLDAYEHQSELQAEIERFSILVDGCGCPAPYDSCTHDEPLTKTVERQADEVELLREERRGFEVWGRALRSENEALRSQLAAAHDVIRKLRDGWTPETDDDPPVWYLESGIGDVNLQWDGTAPMSDAERAVLDAATPTEAHDGE